MGFFIGSLPVAGVSTWEEYPSLINNAFNALDSQLNTTNTATSANTSFRQGYSLVSQAVSAYTPDNSLNSAQASYLPTSNYTLTGSYATLSGSSISFTASGNGSRAIYMATIPVHAQDSGGVSAFSWYLDRGGTALTEHLSIIVPQAADDNIVIMVPVAATSGTYSIKVRYFASTTNIYMGAHYYVDGASGLTYRTIRSIIYEV